VANRLRKVVTSARLWLILGFLPLVLVGFRWGLPSRARNALYFTGDGAGSIPALTPEELHNAWRDYPVHLPGTERRGRHARSVFNPLRSYNPDEYVIFKSLARMEPRRLDFFPGFFSWPAAYFYEVGAALGAARLLGIVTLERKLGGYIARPEALARMYLVGRTVSLAFAVGAILLLFAAAERLYGRRAAIIAAAFLMLAPVFVAHARYMTADMSSLFWICAVLYACARIFQEDCRERRLCWCVLAGVAVGLAAATRYKAGICAPFVLWAALLAGEGVSMRERLRRLLQKELWIAGLCAVFVFLLINPWILLRFGEFADQVAKEAASASGGQLPWARVLVLYPIAGLTLPLCLAMAGGVVLILARRRRADVLLLLCLLPTAAAVLLARPTMLRYALPALPPAAMAAACLFGDAPAPGRIAGALKRFGLVACLVWPLLVTVAWGAVYALEDPRADAGRWIVANVPPGDGIGVIEEPWQFHTPPLDAQRYRVVVTERDVAALAESRADYLVFSDYHYPPLRIGGPLDAEERFFWSCAHGASPVGSWRYRLAAEFRAPARIPGLPFLEVPASRWAIHDLRYPNPSIRIMRREKDAPDGR